MAGQVDDGRIYDRALGGNEIFDLYRSTIRVAVDILPGDSQNEFDGTAEPDLGVAILSSDLFDATLDLDPASLSVAGARVQMLGEGSYGCTVSDVNEDGADDVTCLVPVTSGPGATGISNVVVEGMTVDGFPF